MQNEEDFCIAHISGVEERNRLQILLCELLKKNHKLRLEVAQLQGDD
jgi:hypothetical protein